MARKSLRTSGLSAERSSSKRPAPPETAGGIQETSKRAKSQSTSKISPSKNEYFDPEQSDEDSVEEESPRDQESADYEESAATVSSEEDVASDFDEEESITTVHQARESATKSTASGGKSELWRSGVKTGLGPGTQVVFKKPKAREAGATPYEDNTIHPNTMAFLGDLAANNDRQWLKSECNIFLTKDISYGDCSTRHA